MGPYHYVWLHALWKKEKEKGKTREQKNKIQKFPTLSAVLGRESEEVESKNM